jgi:hypothetical protein
MGKQTKDNLVDVDSLIATEKSNGNLVDVNSLISNGTIQKKNLSGNGLNQPSPLQSNSTSQLQSEENKPTNEDLFNTGLTPEQVAKKEQGYVPPPVIATDTKGRPVKGVAPNVASHLPNIKDAIDNTVNDFISKYEITDPKGIEFQRDAITKQYQKHELVPVLENGRSVLKQTEKNPFVAFDNALRRSHEQALENNYLFKATKDEAIDYMNHPERSIVKERNVAAGLGKVGEFGGENAEFLEKGTIGSLGGAATPFTGGASFGSFLAMAKDLAEGGYGQTLFSNYRALKEQHPEMTDSEAFDKAHTIALGGEVAQLGTGAILSKAVTAKLPEANIPANDVINTVTKSAEHAIKSAPKVIGSQAAATAATDILGETQGVHKDVEQVLKDVGESAKNMTAMHFGLWGLSELPNIAAHIVPQITNLVASANRGDVADFYSKAEEQGIVPEGTSIKVAAKLAEFDEQKKVVQYMPIPEENKAAITDKLIQKKNLVEEREKLEEHKEAFKPRIEEINKQIDGIDAEIGKLYSAKDVFDVEIKNQPQYANTATEKAPQEKQSEVIKPETNATVNEPNVASKESGIADKGIGEVGKGTQENKIETDKAEMEGVSTNYVENEDGEKIKLPQKGFLIDGVNLKDEADKGKGYGQELYKKALDEHGVLYSHFPISEDAFRVHDKLVEKGLATREHITLSDGTELIKLTKTEPKSPTEIKPQESDTTKITNEQKADNQKILSSESNFPKPEKPIHEMNSDELDSYAKKVRDYNKGLEVDFFGKDGAKKYREAQGILNNYLIHREDPRYKAASKLVDEMEASLTPQQANEFFAMNAPKGLIYDDAEIRDVAQKVRLVEEAENIDELSSSIKSALRNFKKDNPSNESLAILNAAKKKAVELNIVPTELIKQVIKKVGGQYKDIDDAALMMKDAFEKLVPTETQKILSSDKDNSIVGSENKVSDDYYSHDSEQNTFKKEPNAKPVKLEKGVDAFSIKRTYDYAIHDTKSGALLGWAKTLKDAIADANERINRNTQREPYDKFQNEYIDKNGISPRFEQQPKETESKKNSIVGSTESENAESKKVGSTELAKPKQESTQPIENKTEISGNEPPKEPPLTENESREELPDFKNKSVLNRLNGSKNIPDYVKERFADKGLKYKPQSHDEAREVAKGVINEYGHDNAVTLAEAGKFDGDTNSLIFAEAIDQTYKLETEAKTPEEKLKYAEQWADYAIRYDETARDKGRFISAIYDFYKKSPLGVQIAEKAKRDQAFKDWFKDKNKDFKEVFEELKKEPEFEKLFKEEVNKGIKEERSTERQSRKEKVHKTIDDTLSKWADKLKAKGAEGASKQGIGVEEIFKSVGATMKAAYDAGESVVKIVQDAVEFISEKLGHDNWGKEEFKKEWEDKLRDKMSAEDAYKTRLKNQISELDEQIKNNKKNVKEKVSKDYDDETKKLIEERDAKKKQLDEITKVDTTKEQRILDKFRKKLKGLSDQQKEDVIRRSFKQIVENGALEYDDFKKIIADTIGLGEMSDKDKVTLSQYVADINSVQDFADAALKNRTPKSLQEFHAATLKAEKSATELARLVYNKPDVLNRILSVMQLNTLGLVSLIKNVSYNVFYQGLIRAPRSLIMTGLDQSIYGISNLANKIFGSRIIKPDTNIFLAQQGYFSGGKKGGAQSVKQLYSGLTNRDYFQKEIYNSQIKPATAVKDLWAWKKGEKFLTNAQVVDKVIQATIGVPAEGVARLLNVGDKPFRFSAEEAVASTIAQTEFGLKGIDKELFVTFPKEEALRYYKNKGIPHEQALAKAEQVEARIIGEGEHAVFQQANLITEGLNAMGRAMKHYSEDKPVAQVVSAAFKILGKLNAPFLKTPLNIGWELYNLANPGVALAQSAIYAFRGAYDAYKGQGTPRLDFIQAKRWAAHAVVGTASLGLYSYFSKIGAITGGNAKDEKQKEKEAETYYSRPHSLNISKVWRASLGDDTADQDGDLQVDLSWYGLVGGIMNIQSNKFENMTPEEKAAQGGIGDLLFGNMQRAAAEGFEQGAFSGTFSLLNAYQNGGGYADSWLLGMINLGTNVIEPATLAQFSRATLPYRSTIKADSFLGELKNNFSTRSLLFRAFAGYPPSSVTIWGDKADRNVKGAEGVAFNMLGIDKFNKNAFAEPLFQDYKRTNNLSFFPPSVKGKFTEHGKEITLDIEQTRQLQTLVGQRRKALIEPFVNDKATIKVYNKEEKTFEDKLYSQITDDANKLKYLNKLYDQGREQGKDQFLKVHPELLK